jgi:hypothetical protein
MNREIQTLFFVFQSVGRVNMANMDAQLQMKTVYTSTGSTCS